VTTIDMDARFLPAANAIRQSDTRAFVRFIEADPSLARDRSSQSHPTLMQCLALDGANLPLGAQKAMALALLDAGSAVDEPLIATGSVGNDVLADILLDHGAKLNGDPQLWRGWCVLEEALYWGHPRLCQRLLQRGATQHTLRIAAGLGNLDGMRSFFDAHDELRDPASQAINWPFGAFPPEQQSEQPLDILDNALAYAAMGGHLSAVDFLLARGAAINAWPRGFHYRGTVLHWTAVRGLRSMIDALLERGANAALKDMTENMTPAEWARFGKNESLAQYLDSKVTAPEQ
jgi:hypothetical protein